MSHTVPSQHPAVVLRSTYEHLRALLAIACLTIVGLTVAVAVMAISNSTTTSRVTHSTTSAISKSSSADSGAKLDHRGQKPTPPESQLNMSYFYTGHY